MNDCDLEDGNAQIFVNGCGWPAVAGWKFSQVVNWGCPGSHSILACEDIPLKLFSTNPAASKIRSQVRASPRSGGSNNADTCLLLLIP